MKQKIWVNHPLTFGPRPSRLRRWLIPAMALPLVIGLGYTLSKQLSPTASKSAAAPTSLTHASPHVLKAAPRPEGRARIRR